MMHSSGVWTKDLEPQQRGLFDYVRCSMDIGQLTNVTCETRSLGGNCSRYWISPAGELFVIDYEGTHDFVIITEDDPEYDRQFPWRNTDIQKNGLHGSVSPVNFSGYLDLEPNWLLNPDLEHDWKMLVFRDGLCQLE